MHPKELLRTLADVLAQACGEDYDPARNQTLLFDEGLSAYEDAIAFLAQHGFIEFEWKDKRKRPWLLWDKVSEYGSREEEK